MKDTSRSPQKQERENTLAQDRKKILNLTPELALKTIAEHPYPVTLVQSMAEEDLYFLIHHIGPEDAIPVIALASNSQWEYLLDMEVWEKDHINAHEMTRWLGRLRKADPDRFTHWIANEKLDETTLYLFRNLELHIREYDQDPGEIDDRFYSEDQTYYIRLRPYPKSQNKLEEERDLFIKDLLNRISVYDYTLYRKLLLSSDAIVPAETEEELYRLRNNRLAEKGLLPFEEAIGVYQPLKTSELPYRSRKTESFEGRILDTYPLPIDSNQPAEDTDLFARTLSQIHDGPTLNKLQAEFAALCNQVISADQKQIREKDRLAEIVRKVSGYISIGLEKTELDIEKDTPYISARLIQDHLLADIFRVGYGCALSLKWQAKKWHRASWTISAGLPLQFWGEQFMGVLGGLLIKKPLYFDNYATGSLYREFASMADIENTETQIECMIALDDLFSRMAIEIRSDRGEDLLTFENVLLTLWANHYLNTGGHPNSPHPLPMEQFKRLFNDLWDPGTKPRKISETMREIFFSWLIDRSELTAYDISARMAPELEQLFIKIENELGNVAEKDLDSRFISLFLITRQDR